MSDAPVFGFNCTNPECGRLFKMRYPGKPGYFKVSCPHCGSKVTVKMPSPSDINRTTGGDSGKADATNEANTPPNPDVHEQPKEQPAPQNETTADNSGKPVIDYEDYPEGKPYFNVGERAVIICPHCHNRKLGYTAQKEGMLKFTCPGCKGKIRVWFQTPTVLIDPERFNPRQAKIVHVRPLWLNTDYPLPPGEHTIGRADADKPSTISIKGDSTMSRQSIAITAFISPNEGFKYRLRVLNATNPVIHAGRMLTEGEEVYLNFGDEIRLGNTLLRFVEDEKAPKFNNV